MEHYDSQKAQRVWGRVWAEAPDTLPHLQRILLSEMQAAADYRRLLRRFPEMRLILEQTRKSIACLRGILILTGGIPPTSIPPKQKEEPTDVMLRRCTGQCLKTAADLAACGNDPEYGCILARLAEQKQQQCTGLLELIGREPAE